MSNSPIIIPSKHIYQIDNQKVIDNKVGKIEVQVKSVEPDNHYDETVYNEDINNGFTLNSSPIQKREVTLFNNVVDVANPIVYFYTAYIYADNQYYVSKTINIPIQLDTKHIVASILTGLNSKGEKNIKYVCQGKIVQGITNSSVVFTATTSGTNVQSYSAIIIPPTNDGYYQEQENSGIFFVPTQDSYTTKNSDGTISVTAKIDIPSIDNLAEITASEVTIEGKQYFQLSLQNILCGIRITKGGGRGTAVSSATNKTVLSGSVSGGRYIEYIPEMVTISVYGNTVGINLRNEVITIGDGNNVMSFSGNELMQMTNTPSVEETYEKASAYYKNGKEVATIRVGIEDYDSEVAKYIDINVINTYKEGDEEYYYEFTSTEYQFKVGDLFRLGTEWNKVLYIVGDVYGSVASYEVEQEEKTVVIMGKKKSISKSGENGLPMTFHIGDIVIPYIYGADHKDKPMSLNKDGTPKQFKVISKGLPTNGAIFQRLVLQEYTEQ